MHNLSAYWKSRKKSWLLSYCFGIVLCGGDLYKNNLTILVWTNLSTQNRFSRFKMDMVQLVRPLLDFTFLLKFDFNCTSVSGHTIIEKDCSFHLVAFLWYQIQKCVWSGMHYCSHYCYIWVLTRAVLTWLLINLCFGGENEAYVFDWNRGRNRGSWWTPIWILYQGTFFNEPNTERETGSEVSFKHSD